MAENVLPGEGAWMGVVPDEGPVLLGDEPGAAFPPWRCPGQDLRPGPSAAVDIAPGIGGIGEDSQAPRLHQRLPHPVVTLAHAPQAGWDAQTVPVERGDDCEGRALLLEQGKEAAARRLDFRIGIAADTTRRLQDEARWWAKAPGAGLGLFPLAA